MKWAKTSPDQSKPKTSGKTSSKGATAAKRRPVARKRTVSPRVRRMRQAFVASTSLRPMAQQLLQDRSQPAYAGVESFARTHAKDDAGALAFLVLGYAHVLDRDFGKAIDPLNRAKVHAGDLGDYVDYYLGNSYLQTGHTAQALATLADFAKSHPDSLLVRDAQVHYADALLLEGQPGEAVTLLEQIRTCRVEEAAVGAAAHRHATEDPRGRVDSQAPLRRCGGRISQPGECRQSH